jgi:heptosyltransferase-1
MIPRGMGELTDGQVGMMLGESVSPAALPQRVLIIKPSSLGDVVHALPVLAAARRAWPRAHVAWLVSRSYAPLLEGHPLLDEVILFDRRRYGHMWRHPGAALDLVRFVRALHGRAFDLVLDLQGLFRSALLAWVSGARRRVGFRTARELAPLFYSQRVDCDDGARHAVDRNLRVLASCGVAVRAAEFPLPVRPAEREAACRMLRESTGQPLESFTAISPGARWASKRWRSDRIAALIDALDERGMGPCVLLGTPEERKIGLEVAAACRRPPIDLVGRTALRELVAVLSLAARVVAHDSGTSHLAAALGRPLVSLFGPTDPWRTGPYGPTVRIVARDVPCAPCLRRRCPLGHHDCMESLTPEAVVSEVLALESLTIPGSSAAAVDSASRGA